MITVKQLSFGYTRRRNIFDSLSLELPKGSIVGLLGRNGEGKTTLLKLLYGQLLRRQGELKVLDSDPKHRAVSFLQQVYLLPEEFRVPPISIRSFFDISAPFYPNYDEAVAKELIDIFGLQWDMNLKKISQGQKKKALIAFALSLRVPLLLLDEPTNGLDIPSKGEFRRAVARYTSDEQTILISTHQVRDLEQLIDRVLIMERGSIFCNATVADITERLSFRLITPELANKALYSEPSAVGTVGILPNDGNEESESNYSMELFFNAVISERDRILQALSQGH
ncbi:ABC transporter ATP-binding protein [Porphyromonas catoniae]|jgi:probable ABC transporter ATP-binding protein|uniref:ABC transporter ATP-binding protein n=1 Tax=Porphyromonas catoniae TaxID=41976 RepID=UPI0028D5AF6A|nr:ABC transporter ATP-binding protein [Porphyromonas catoniae]